MWFKYSIWQHVVTTRHITILGLLLAHFWPQFASAAPYGSGWYRELQFAVGYEDNLSRASQSDDKRGDSQASASLGIGYADKVGDRFDYVVAAYLTYAHQQDNEALTSLASAIGANLIWQPVNRYSAPWYVLDVNITRLDYKDSDAREGYLANARLGIHRRIGANVVGRIGYGYNDLVFDKSDVDANRDAAFDVARHEIFVGADWHLGGRVYLVGEYSFQHGGFTGSASGNLPAGIKYDAETIDPAFESCSALICTPFYAYRSVTDLHIVDLGVAFSLGGLDYDLGGRYLEGKSENGATYSDWLVQLGVIWNF